MDGVVARYSDVSRERIATIFDVTELVHMYAAVIWKKTCDAYTKRFGVISQSQAVTYGRKDMTVHNLWQCCPQ